MGVVTIGAGTPVSVDTPMLDRRPAPTYLRAPASLLNACICRSVMINLLIILLVLYVCSMF